MQMAYALLWYRGSVHQYIMFIHLPLLPVLKAMNVPSPPPSPVRITISPPGNHLRSLLTGFHLTCPPAVHTAVVNQRTPFTCRASLMVFHST